MLKSMLIGSLLGGAYGHSFVRRISSWLIHIKENNNTSLMGSVLLVLRFFVDFFAIAAAFFLLTHFLHLNVLVEGCCFLVFHGLSVWYFSRRCA